MNVVLKVQALESWVNDIPRIHLYTYTYLNLLSVSSCDIRYSPTDFLAYRLFQVGTQQMQETRQDAAAEDQLRLNVVARHYVTNCS